MDVPSQCCQVEAESLCPLLSLSCGLIHSSILTGWPTLSSAHEVGCVTILRDPTVVRNFLRMPRSVFLIAVYRTTLIAVILDYRGLYCEDSWSPGWGHLYVFVLTQRVLWTELTTFPFWIEQITTIVSISVSISMYCLIQLYIPVSLYLKPHKPLLKLFAIKAVGSCAHFSRLLLPHTL